MKMLLSGEELPADTKEYIAQGEEECEIDVSFSVAEEVQKETVNYCVALKKDADGFVISHERMTVVPRKENVRAVEFARPFGRLKSPLGTSLRRCACKREVSIKALSIQERSLTMSRRKDNKGRVLRTGESQRKDLISIFCNHCSRCRSTCCRRSRSLCGNEAHRDLPAGWGNPSRPRGQNEWACPENSCRIYRPFGFAAACLAGGSACRP